MVEFNAPGRLDADNPERRSDCGSPDRDRSSASKPRLERLQVCVPKNLMDRCWNIASIDRVTVASLVEEALSREIRRRELERGEPYPTRRDWRQRRRIQ